ncbi:hypothetical protein ABKA04_004822 [Annulohypoxylon sp. FPYF3050]
MVSPTKKRKLNTGSSKSSGLPSRGLEYFFSKQNQNNNSESDAKDDKRENELSLIQDEGHGLTDEELARKLQAEWNKEPENAGRVSGSPPPSTISTSIAAPAIAETSQRLRESPDPIPKVAKFENKGKGTLSLQSVSASVDSISETIPFDESPLTFDPTEYVPKLREHWSNEGGDASYALLTRCFVLVWLATNSISPPYISLELGIGGSAISKALRNVCGLDNRSLKAIYDKHGDAGDVAFEAKKKQSFTLRKPRPLTIKGVYQSLVKVANAQGQGSAEVKQRIVDRLLQDARGGEESRYIVRTLCQHLRIGAVKTTMLIALSRAFLLSRPANAEFSLKSITELKGLKKEELVEIWSKAEEVVKACFARRPNYNDLIPTMLEIGVCDELLLRCDLALHIPLRPMLGSITRDLSEMLTKLQGRDFACEFKYDGQRAQVHCDDKGKVSIFSRHLEVMTDKYPDLVELVPKIRGEGVSSFIMEGEVVAVDQQSGELKNFQTLTNRARKDVEIGSITIEVCLFAFDLMYLNGQPLLDRPFRERRSLLRSLFIEIPNRFTWVKSLDATSQDSEVVLDFFKQAIDTKCEGIMVKILDNLLDLPAPTQAAGDINQTTGEVEESETLALPSKSKAKKGKGKAKGSSNDGTGEEKKTSSRRKALLATYEPDKRLDSWLKVKKDYSSSFDTLDLVPIAAWHGQGRKAKWWSPILMAVRNDATGSLEAVCKCISGFTDAFYKANKKFYDDGSGEEAQEENTGEPNEEEDDDTEEADAQKYKNIRRTKPSFIEYYGPEPDVWFEPQEVWEMAFADITLSPTYTASIGLVSQERGLSLRFPRFLKKREDKGIEEASSSEFLAGLYRKQEAKAPTAPADQDIGDDEDEL